MMGCWCREEPGPDRVAGGLCALGARAGTGARVGAGTGAASSVPRLQKRSTAINKVKKSMGLRDGPNILLLL